MLGVINHHQATKGNYFLALLALPAVIPPTYALIATISRHLIVGHLMVLVLHYMVYAYVSKRQKNEAVTSEATAASGETDSESGS